MVRVAEVARIKRGVHPSVMEPGDTLLVQHWYVKLYFDNHIYTNWYVYYERAFLGKKIHIIIS